MSERMSPKQFEEFEGMQDWRVVEDGAGAYFRTASFAESATFVQAIGELPAVSDHPPKVDIRHDGVTFRLMTTTDEWYGMTTTDVEVAAAISRVAKGMGLKADPAEVQSVLVIPGSTDITKVMPFWRAILGYEPRPDSPNEDLVDPHRRGPSFWFEKMGEPRADGLGAIHLAIFVPFEHADDRIAAALAAGGRMVRDEYAPSWWTLADWAGNEADIATTRGRD